MDGDNRILLSLRLHSVREVGDKSMEEKDHISYDHGSASSSDVKKVMEPYNRVDKHGECNAYRNLGNACGSQGYLKKVVKYCNRYLKIAQEVGDKHSEGSAFCNLGNAYGSLGDFKKAKEYHNLHLKIAKEVGDTHGESNAYGNLGNSYYHLGDLKKP